MVDSGSSYAGGNNVISSKIDPKFDGNEVNSRIWFLAQL